MTYKQKEGKRFDEFMTQLKKLSIDCEFGELKNYLIKDIVVIGVIHNSLRERMLREPNLILKRQYHLPNKQEGIYIIKSAKRKIGICHPKKDNKTV